MISLCQDFPGMDLDFPLENQELLLFLFWTFRKVVIVSNLC